MLYPFVKHYDEATGFVKSVAKRLGTPGDLEHANKASVRKEIQIILDIVENLSIKVTGN